MDHRILIVDDNVSIHEDFKKILTAAAGADPGALQDARNAFFGEVEAAEAVPNFRLDSAFQGQEALAKVKEAIAAGDPYSMAFVDVRMPPGWDGVETILELWKVAPDLECVICTAFSDYTWSEMAKTLGQSDKLLILKKPFDPVEARQFATALTTKWQGRREQERMTKALIAAESQAKAYAASLETVNQALRTSKASADKAASRRGEFLMCLSDQVRRDVGHILQAAEALSDPSLDASIELGHTLLTTVTGVLDYTQLESGAYPDDVHEVEPEGMVSRIVDRFRDRAHAQGSDLILNLGNGMQGTYIADSVSVEKLVVLLIDNALRHGKASRVEVKSWVERTGDWSKPSLYVQVTDNGPGLPKNYLTQMYEPLVSMDEGTRFGIGLAVAKQLVQSMGGDLSHRRLDPGTQFTFHVKVAEASAKRAV
ncbi:MAG: hybrid sensor histidine kinase/response regulator [Planctomycetota bacterium]